MIDKLLQDFQFWNNLIPNHTPDSSRYINQFPQITGAPNEDLMVEDPIGVESNIYQQVQKSANLICQESHLSLLDYGDALKDQDNLKVLPLSIQ